MLPIFLALTFTFSPLMSSLASAAAIDPDKGSDIQHRDAEEIADLIRQQFAAWNRRDIDGYMKAFWASPLLIFAVESEVWVGWEQVKANLLHEYSDPDRMGKSALDRLQTNTVSSETAMTIEWWSIVFRATKVSGFTTSVWHKFPVGWRIIQGHSSVLETQ
jgi:hypothetical protein